MPTYSAITNAEIDPDSPITTSLMTKMRDNPIASLKCIRRSVNGPDKQNNTTLSDDGVLQFSVDANQTYCWALWGQFQCRTADALKLAFTAPVGTVLSFSGVFATGGSTEYDGRVFGTVAGTGYRVWFAGSTANDVTPSFIIRGYGAVGGTAGNIKFQYAEWVAGGGGAGTYIVAGSAIEWFRMDDET